MILIPELETVVILIPRTGSGSLRRAIEQRYPRSILIYRHMEADGVPQGYGRWPKVAVLRDPLERMWSLYKFLRDFDNNRDDPAYIAAMQKQAARPFADWLINNQVVFTAPYDSAGLGRFWPHFTVRHPLPENRKSQFIYARPDLGTEMLQFSDIAAIERRFDVSLDQHNRTPAEPMGPLTPEAVDYLNLWFRWDLQATSPSPHNAFPEVTA